MILRERVRVGNHPGDRATAVAQNRTITCESEDNRRRNSYIASNTDRDGVRLMRRLSNSRCESGSDWGTTSTSVWVDNGCRPVFSYSSRGEPGYGPPFGGGNQSSRTN